MPRSPKISRTQADYLSSLPARFDEPVVHFYMGPLLESSDESEIISLLDRLLETLSKRHDLEVLSIDLADNPKLATLFWDHFKRNQDKWIDAIEQQAHLKYWGICHLNEPDVGSTKQLPTKSFNPYWPLAQKDFKLPGYETEYAEEQAALCPGLESNHTWLSFNFQGGLVGDDAHWCKSLRNAQSALEQVNKILVSRDILKEHNATRLQSIMFRNALQKELRTPVVQGYDVWEQVLSSLLDRYVDTSKIIESGFTIHGDKFYPYLDQHIHAYIEFEIAPSYVWQKLFEVCERQGRTTPRSIQTMHYHSRHVINAVIDTLKAGKFCPIKAIKSSADYDGLSDREFYTIEKLIKADISIRYTLSNVYWFHDERADELQERAIKNLKTIIALLKEHDSTLELVIDFSTIYNRKGASLPEEVKALCLEITSIVERNRRTKRQEERHLRVESRRDDADLALPDEDAADLSDIPADASQVAQIKSPYTKRKSKQTKDVTQQLRIEQQVEAQAVEQLASATQTTNVTAVNQNIAAWAERQEALTQEDATSGFLGKDKSVCDRGNCIQFIRKPEHALFSRYGKKSNKRIVREILAMSDEEILRIWDNLTGHLTERTNPDELRYMTQNAWAYLLIHYKQLKSGLTLYQLPKGMYKEGHQGQQIVCFDGVSIDTKKAKGQSLTQQQLYTSKAPSKKPFDFLARNIQTFIKTLPKSKVKPGFYEGAMSAAYLMKDLFCQYGFLLEGITDDDLRAFRHIYSEYGVDGVLQVLEDLDYRYVILREQGKTDLKLPNRDHSQGAVKRRFPNIYDRWGGARISEEEIASRNAFLKDFPVDTRKLADQLVRHHEHVMPSVKKEIDKTLKGLNTAQYFSLQNIYFKEGMIGLKSILSEWQAIGIAHPNTLSLIKEVLLRYSDNIYAFIKSDEYESSLQLINAFNPNELRWFHSLLQYHGKASGSLDIPNMTKAFKAFLIALKQIDTELVLPDVCELLDADNFYTSLQRITDILQRSSAPNEQIKLLQGLSLKQEGPLFALKHNNYKVVSKEMMLSVEQCDTDVLTYVQGLDTLKEKANDETLSYAEFARYFFREIAQSHFRYAFEHYQLIYQNVLSSSLEDNDKKKLIFILAKCSTDKRNYHGFNESDLISLMTEIIGSEDKPLFRFFEETINLSPSLQEALKLNCLFSLFDHDAQMELIKEVRRIINRNGTVGYDALSNYRLPIPPIDSTVVFRELSHALARAAIPTLDINARITSSGIEFLEEEIEVITRLLRHCDTETDIIRFIEERLLLQLKSISEHDSIIETVKGLNELLDKNYIDNASIGSLVKIVSKHHIPSSVLNQIARLPLHEKMPPDEMESALLFVTCISNDPTIKARDKQAILCTYFTVLAKSKKHDKASAFVHRLLPAIHHMPENRDVFINKFQHLDNEDIDRLIDEAIYPLVEEQTDSSSYHFLLVQNPTGLAIIGKASEALRLILLSLLAENPDLTQSAVEQIISTLDALDAQDILYLNTLAETHTLPTPILLLKAISEKSLERIEWDKYGRRSEVRIEEQLSQKEVLRAISQNESMLPGHTRDIDERAKLYARFKSVNAYSRSFIKVSNEHLKERQSTLLEFGEITEEIILEFIAIQREMAYRFGPQKDGEGLYANSTQILAVIDVLFHDGHLGLQVPTGEGKSLISALIGSCRTHLSNKPIDLLSANQTLAYRDYINYRRFYAQTGIPVSYVHAKSQLADYHQAEGKGINIASAGSMNLFQSRFLFEGKLESVTNHLLLDECDDLMLDKRTHYNHPITLHGDRSSESKSNVWAWVYPGLNAFIETERFKDEAATRSDDVLNAKRFLASYPSGTFDIEKWNALNDPNNNIDLKLSTWLDSAVFARALIEDKHFMIIEETREDEEGQEKPVRYARILSDGRPDYDAQWGNGVHQCVHARLNQQAKQKGELQNFVIEAEQDIAFSTNAKNFLDRYEDTQKCALSATPGSALELIELNKKYGFEFYTLPHHQANHREELPTLFADNDEQFYQHVLRQIKHARDFKKPMLFVCKDTAHAKTLYARLEKDPMVIKWGVDHQSITGQSPKEEAEKIKAAGRPGMITISTPMIGRGTDIQLEAPEKGFRVWQTFSARKRIDIQIMGRSARQGQIGEYGELLNLSKEPELASTLKSRYTRHTDMSMAPIWQQADNVEAEKRLLEESVSDIRNVLNQLYMLNVSQPGQDREDIQAEWTILLRDFEDEWRLIQDKQEHSPHEKIKSLCDYADKAWQIFVSKKKITLKSPSGFYESYLNFIVQADKRWFNLGDDFNAPPTPIVFGQEDREAQFKEHFDEWNQAIKTHTHDESEDLIKKYSTMANVYAPKSVISNTLSNIRKHYIRESYDPNLAGHARIYSTLFADERALLTGRKNFFSSFLAYIRNVGTLFAETKAVLKGERPFFANTRMTLKTKRIKSHIKEIDEMMHRISHAQTLIQGYLSKDAASIKCINKDLIKLSKLKEELLQLGNTFSDDSDIDNKKTQIKTIQSAYVHGVVTESDMDSLPDDDYQAYKKGVLNYINSHTTEKHAKSKKGAFREERIRDIHQIAEKIREQKSTDDIDQYVDSIKTGRRHQSDLKDSLQSAHQQPPSAQDT